MPNTTDNGPQWSEPDAMELWKYFGGVGAADKNTMVTVESLLLGFSAGLIGYVVTKLLCYNPLSVSGPLEGIFVAVLGIAISGIAGYVSLLYAGYSNWNWAQADAIARDQVTRHTAWAQFLPEEADAIRERWKSEGYDLRLMSVDATEDLEDEGRQLVIVALVGTNLQIRIVDASGNKVVDKAENELDGGEMLTALKQRLTPFPEQSSLSQKDKQKIIRSATSIAGHNLPRKTSFLCAVALRLGRPCYPTKQVAPIFWLYGLLALGAMIFHLTILLLSLHDSLAIVA